MKYVIDIRLIVEAPSAVMEVLRSRAAVLARDLTRVLDAMDLVTVASNVPQVGVRKAFKDESCRYFIRTHLDSGCHGWAPCGCRSAQTRKTSLLAITNCKPCLGAVTFFTLLAMTGNPAQEIV